MSFKKQLSYTLFFILIFPFVLNASDLSKMYIEGNGKRLQNAIVPQDTLDANGLQASMIRIITDMKGSLKLDSNRGIIGSNIKPGQTDIFLSKHTRQIKIFKEGFEPLEVILSNFGVVLEEGAVFELRLLSNKKKDIVIISNPSDVEKIIDGKSLGIAKALKLPLGKHTLTLKKEGYRTKHIKIAIDDTTTLLQGEQFKLEEIEPTVLKIDSFPKGAKVFINEQEEGETPYTSFKFPDVYRLRISKNGYIQIEEKIEVKEKDTENNFSYNLTKNASFINLSIIPSDAKVFVNNIEQKVINDRLELAPATYKIEIKKQGYDSASKVISLKLKDEIDLNFNLKQHLGKLQFSVNPINANISLLQNNKEIQKWQGLKYLKNLPVGEYEIVAKQEGYKTYKKKILIEKDKLNNFTAVLTVGTDGQKEITNSIGMEFVLVERGTFKMGSDSGGSYEKPIHTVNITKDFYVGKYEVTNEQVVQVYNWAKSNNISNLTFSSSSVKYNGNELLDLDDSDCEIGYRSGSLYVKNNKDKYPCIEITWYGSEAFCKFLNKKEGADKYRLLTEAEWEYASRGGNKSKGYKYSGSNSIDEVAWYRNNPDTETHEVGLKQSNELGIYDMSGNVYEWVQDKYDSNYYSKSIANNPLNSSGSYFVLRGGSWGCFSSGCRVASRDYFSPADSSVSIGFRLTKTL